MLQNYVKASKFKNESQGHALRARAAILPCLENCGKNKLADHFKDGDTACNER